jgi:transaldolase
VSRVDAKADAVLPPNSPLRGRIAIANAELAYGRYLERFSGERWHGLWAAGGRVQRPLWASTGTKNPDYSDVLYVEQLIAPGVINTMPKKTLYAFAEHGRVEQTLSGDIDEAGAVLSAAAAEGVHLGTITNELEGEGVEAFCDSYEQLLGRIESRVGSLVGTR